MRIIFLLLMLACSVQAQNTANEPLVFYQSCFGGVDNYHDSSRIDKCDFQDARNILTDRGFLEKRPGSERVVDSVLAGYPIRYIKEYITQSNAKYLIIHSSSTIYSTDFSAAPVVVSTVNINGVVSSISGFNKHFIVNGYDIPIEYNGTAASAINTMPICKFVEFAHERLWCANAAGYESTLYASAYGDYTDWTLPVPPLTADAPNSFTFDRQDGKPLTGIFATPYGILAFKRTKTFILKGVDNDDFEKFRLSDNIGCIDIRSVQVVNGYIQWLGEDGIYRWNGGSNAPELISREIDSTIKNIRQSNTNTDNQSITSQADFTAGVFTTNGPSNSWSATIAPGAISASSWTHVSDETVWTTGTQLRTSTQAVFDSLSLAPSPDFTNVFVDYFTDGDYTATPAWTCTGGTGDCARISISGGQLLTNYGGWLDGAIKLATPTSFTTSPVNTVKSTLYAKVQTLLYNGNSDIALTYWAAADYSALPGNGIYLKIRALGSSGDPGYGTITAQLYKRSVYVDTLLGTDTLSHTSTAPDPYVECSSISIVANGTTISAIDSTCGLSISAPFTEVVHSDVGIIEVVGSQGLVYVDNVTNQAGVYYTSGTWTSPVYDTSFSTTVDGPHWAQDTVPAGSTVVYKSAQSPDGITFGDWFVITSTLTTKIPFTQRYRKEQIDFTNAISTQTPSVQRTQLQVLSTGTWDSSVLYLGNEITSWGQLNANLDISNANHIKIYLRSSTNTFVKTDSTIGWTLQTNGNNITISTGAYLQARLISIPGASTDTVKVNAITFNWYEGESKQVASLFYDGRYFLAVNSTDTVTNNELVIVQQRTGEWTLFDGQSWGALALYDFKPYAGSGLTESKIWRIMYEDHYYDDNTLAINAYAITKDFQFDGQNNNKILRNLYLESYPGNTAGVLSMAYSVDKSTTYYTTVQTLTANTMFNDEIKKFFPGYAKGRYAKFKFSNNVVNESIKIDAYTIFGEIERLYRR